MPVRVNIHYKFDLWKLPVLQQDNDRLYLDSVIDVKVVFFHQGINRRNRAGVRVVNRKKTAVNLVIFNRLKNVFKLLCENNITAGKKHFSSNMRVSPLRSLTGNFGMR